MPQNQPYDVYVSSNPIQLQRKMPGCLRIGCILLPILLGIVLFCGGCLFVTTWFMAEARPLPGGDYAHFDPVAYFGEIAAYAGENPVFTGMTVYYVKADGTLDMYVDYRPHATYGFYNVIEDSTNRPVGADGSEEGVLYQPVDIEIEPPWQLYNRSISSGGSRTTYTYLTLGMDRNIHDPRPDVPDDAIPAPVCDFADLWAEAIERGAPEDAVAVIRYDENGYSFMIQGTSITLNFTADCKLER